ncbi:MAG: ABC transporter permease [Candidatus Saccharimonas sp.]
MKRIDIMKRAGRNLRQAKGRTFLTSLAIAVGAFTLTLSLAAGEGARQYADNLLKNNIDPQALFILRDKSLTDGSGGQSGMREYSTDLSEGYRQGTNVKMVSRADVTGLEKRSDLTQVVPVYSLSPKYVVFEGVTTKYAAPLTYYDASILTEASAGTMPNIGEQIGDNEILLPQEFVDQLGMQPAEMVGKTVSVTIGQQQTAATEADVAAAFARGGEAAVAELVRPATKDFTYTVRAVLKKSPMALTAMPRLHVSTHSARAINDYANMGVTTADKFVGVTAIAKGDPAVVKAEIEKAGYTVQTAKDAQGILFTFVNILQGIVAGFAMLALIASVFGIINTQYISVLERTSQIGLMKALGMSRRAIAKLFRYEAAWIGFLGGALGVLLALVLGWFLNPVITKTLDLGNNTLLIFVWWHIALLLVSLVIIAILAGWFPARKAARLDPIEALRTE